jgi:hypothetical protein
VKDVTDWASATIALSPVKPPKPQDTERPLPMTLVARLQAWFFALSTLSSLAACTYPNRNNAIAEAHPPCIRIEESTAGCNAGYTGDCHGVGRGTRATALTISVLRAMDKIKLASGTSLADGRGNPQALQSIQLSK